MFTCLGDVAGGTESLQRVLASQTQGLAGGELQFCLQKGRKLLLTTQDEYERETGSGTGGRGSEDLLSQVDSIVILKIILDRLSFCNAGSSMGRERGIPESS